LNGSPYTFFSFRLFQLFQWAFLHIPYSLFMSVIPVIPLDVSPYSLFSFQLFQLFHWAFLHILSFQFSYSSYCIERFSIFSLFISVIKVIALSVSLSVSPYYLFSFQLFQLFHWAFPHILSFHFR
jgi:hypothetical protein